ARLLKAACARGWNRGACGSPPMPMMLFALDASRAYGEAVAREMGVTLCAHEEREFEDGEHKSRPLASVRDRDVYVIHSLYSDASQSINDKLARLLVLYRHAQGRRGGPRNGRCALPCLRPQ